MIIPPPKPDDAKPDDFLDAPPAYDNALASSSRPSEKGVPRENLSPTSPSPSAQKSRAVPKSSWNLGNLLASPQQRVAQEVRKTVTGLIHDLVRDQTVDSNVSCVGILESCSEACLTHSISMPALLQQPFIEGRTPLYWAIVKRPADEAEPPSFEAPPLVRALLTYSAPLKEATITEIRLACLHTADQRLFQCLRLSPDFEALSHKDQLLLGVRVPPDTVTIGTAARHDAPFTVDFEFAHFQKRMRVSGAASLDFISHARMWEISFFVAQSATGLTDGQWAARLALRENSPAASVDATYTLLQHASEGVPEEPVKLALNGKINHNWRQNMHIALPDAIQYPRSTFLTADGSLRGSLTIQITNK
ncbi:hypothetical protein B0H17DRAFT_1195352 [Mycena rosella]|uniref:Uncharacterized protein n=1 Tax=Mycena rosella TaxID=1033263 RepID=A0AAD7DY35_MYCRO|nr:hypothetical protein B0H17DRAFT_1195352 [Mycena rosella]